MILVPSPSEFEGVERCHLEVKLPILSTIAPRRRIFFRYFTSEVEDLHFDDKGLGELDQDFSKEIMLTLRLPTVTGQPTFTNNRHDGWDKLYVNQPRAEPDYVAYLLPQSISFFTHLPSASCRNGSLLLVATTFTTMDGYYTR